MVANNSTNSNCSIEHKNKEYTKPNKKIADINNKKILFELERDNSNVIGEDQDNDIQD